MISIDTNLLLYARNSDCPRHQDALAFVTACGSRDDVAISELVLVELYVLLRNSAVLKCPLGAEKAAETCRVYRTNPRWRLIECAPVMERVWALVGRSEFARRRIFDARLAFTLRHHGVTELATANVKDFKEFGFSRVWDPTAPEETHGETAEGPHP